MTIDHIPNEVGNQVVYFGTEVLPGTAVTPTGQLFGTFTSNKNQPIRRIERMTGGYDRGINLSRERPTFDGNYTEQLTYQSFPALMQYATAGGVNGVTDGGSPPAYTYTFVPNFDTDDIDSATIVYGVDGKSFRSTGVRFNEWTISADHTSTDNTWDFAGPLFLRDKTPLPTAIEFVATGGSTSTATKTGAGWTINAFTGQWLYQDFGTHIGEVRRILSNTVDTLTLEPPVLSSAVVAGDVLLIAGAMPIISIPEEETITAEGTKIFLDVYDADSSTLGTTDISSRVVSWNISQTLGITPKYRASGMISRVGRAARWITGTIRLEDDRWDEYYEWDENTRVSIRIEKDGTIIHDAVRHSASFDVEKAMWDVITPDADNNNMTQSITWVAEKVPGVDILVAQAVIPEATLP